MSRPVHAHTRAQQTFVGRVFSFFLLRFFFAFFIFPRGVIIARARVHLRFMYASCDGGGYSARSLLSLFTGRIIASRCLRAGIRALMVFLIRSFGCKKVSVFSEGACTMFH